MKSFALVVGAALFASSAVAGGRVGNGGSLVPGPGGYEVADTHFRSIEGNRYVLSSELQAELWRMRDLLERDFGLIIQNPSGQELFVDQIFNGYIEYRIVEKLPSACSFMSPENFDPDLELIDVGCTQGIVTFLTPQFLSMNVRNQAMFVIHERLHALFPDEGYDAKTGIVTAIWLLLERSEKIEWLEERGLDDAFVIEDRLLATVNRLSETVARLSGRTKASDFNNHFMITKDGGVLRALGVRGDRLPSWAIADGFRVLARSSVTTTGGRNNVLKGVDTVLSNSSLVMSGDVVVSAVNVNFEEVSLKVPAGVTRMSPGLVMVDMSAKNTKIEVSAPSAISLLFSCGGTCEPFDGGGASYVADEAQLDVGHKWTSSLERRRGR